MTDNSDAFDLFIEGSGEINGTSFTTTGRGQGWPRDGHLQFEVAFSDIAPDTDPMANVLAALILPTGVFGAERDGARSLLTLAGGEFSFRQVLAGDGVTAESSGRLARTKEREFAWSSSSVGEIALRRVTGIEPVRVIMVPAGLGRLIETIEWRLAESDTVRTIHAVRHFTFAPDAEMPELQLREVTIEPEVRDRSVGLAIRSVIRPFPRARRR